MGRSDTGLDNSTSLVKDQSLTDFNQTLQVQNLGRQQNLDSQPTTPVRAKK